MSHYRRGLSSRVGATEGNYIPGFNAATDRALQRMAASTKRYFGFAFRKLPDGTIMTVYNETDDVVQAADWYGAQPDDPTIVFATYYDTEKEPLHPVEKYIGEITVTAEKPKSLLPWIFGGIAGVVGLVFAGRKRKTSQPTI